MVDITSFDDLLHVGLGQRVVTCIQRLRPNAANSALDIVAAAAATDDVTQELVRRSSRSSPYSDVNLNSCIGGSFVRVRHSKLSYSLQLAATQKEDGRRLTQHVNLWKDAFRVRGKFVRCRIDR